MQFCFEQPNQKIVFLALSNFSILIISLSIHFLQTILIPMPPKVSLMQNNEILVTESECLDDVSIRQSQLEQTPKLIPKLQKQHLNPLIFCFDIAMMLAPGTFTVSMLLWSTKQLEIKAYIAMGLIGMGILGMTLTICNLRVGFKNVLKTLAILDSILIGVLITAAAFFGMMYFLDRGKWEMKILQLAFGISIVVMMLNIRIILLYMKWRRVEVIVYKFFLFAMALEFLVFGIYCFYVNHSFTFNILKKFDQQCRYFIMLYTFAAFDFSCKIIKTFSNFDYTQKFKYAYVIKSVNKGRLQTRKHIVKTIRNLPNEKKQQKVRQVHFIPAVRIGKEK